MSEDLWIMRGRHCESMSELLVVKRHDTCQDDQILKVTDH